MILGATGHRPHRLGMPGVIDPAMNGKLIDFAASVVAAHGPDRVASGMALGWDQAVARAAIRQGIPVDAYVPFPGQESRWGGQQRAAYRWLLERADSVSYAASEFSVEAMQTRNEMIVDGCDVLLTLFDGHKAGGTWRCMLYARERERRMVHLFQNWMEWRHVDVDDT